MAEGRFSGLGDGVQGLGVGTFLGCTVLTSTPVLREQGAQGISQCSVLGLSLQAKPW